MAKRKTPPPPKPARSADPAVQARDAVAHLPVDATGRVKLSLGLSLDRAAVERLSALAITRGRNLEDLAAEILEQAAREAAPGPAGAGHRSPSPRPAAR